ncbi:MAG: HAMP domain-containing histidine kinase [Actinomycetota bacterium]|nr:HAMP domain-containing histidine kinase [Actinomycetota bacterium]
MADGRRPTGNDPGAEVGRIRRPTAIFGLRARSAAAIALGGLAVSVALGFIAYELSRSYLVDKRLDMVRREALVNARFLDGALAEEPASVADVLRETSDPVRPVLIDDSGRWSGAVVGVGAGDVPAELRALVAEGNAALALSSGDAPPGVVVGVPLPRSGTDFYQVFPLVELDSTLTAIRNSLVIAAAITALASAALGVATSRRVLRPLSDVTHAAERITEGDMSARLPAENDPDLQPLIRSFNNMAVALDARIRRERRFAADVSHELRTPLTALTSAVHIIDRRSGEMTDHGRNAVRVLQSQVDHFSQVLLEILDLSRLEAGIADVQVEWVDLTMVMCAVAEESDLDPDLVDIDPDLPARVPTDPRRLRVIVRNLLENAERYAGGCVRLGVSSTATGWQIDVDDRGPGIEHDERELLFERFRRGSAAVAPDSPKGTGLGLSLVWENARAMGGTVVVVDPPHRGSRFRVELPLVTEELQAASDSEDLRT